VTRVQPLTADQAPLLARPYYGPDGSASALTATLAQVPELLEVAMPFIGRVFAPGSVDLRTKEIVVLRVSALNGCRYCVDTHTVAAWDAGLSAAETRALCGAADADIHWEEREAALVAWCDAFCAAPAPVEDAVADALGEHFAEHETVELALLAGATAMLNRFCTALELPASEATVRRLEEAAAR